MLHGQLSEVAFGWRIHREAGGGSTKTLCGAVGAEEWAAGQRQLGRGGPRGRERAARFMRLGWAGLLLLRVGAGLLLLRVMGLAGGSRNRNQLGERAEKMPPQLPHLHT